MRTRASVTLVLLVALGLGGASSTPPAWTGTMEVVRQGSVSEEMGGADVTGRFTQRIHYTFRPDGSASYFATHDETLTVAQGGHSATAIITGHGSGATPAGVEYVEDDSLAQLLLGFDGGWAVSAGEALLTVTWDVPDEDIFGGAYLPIGLVGQLEDSVEERPALGVALATRVTQSTTTLLGSVTATGAGYNLFYPMDGTEQVAYNLTRAVLDPTPRVVIHGPPGGCVDPDDSSRPPLRFLATASHRGGEIAEFTVTAHGEAPEIVYSAGGDSATLELIGTRTTGAVTLDIEYRYEGRSYRAEPVSVEFCALDRPDRHEAGRKD